MLNNNLYPQAFNTFRSRKKNENRAARILYCGKCRNQHFFFFFFSFFFFFFAGENSPIFHKTARPPQIGANPVIARPRINSSVARAASQLNTYKDSKYYRVLFMYGIFFISTYILSSRSLLNFRQPLPSALSVLWFFKEVLWDFGRNLEALTLQCKLRIDTAMKPLWNPCTVHRVRSYFLNKSRYHTKLCSTSKRGDGRRGSGIT